MRQTVKAGPGKGRRQGDPVRTAKKKENLKKQNDASVRRLRDTFRHTSLRIMAGLRAWKHLSFYEKRK